MLYDTSRPVISFTLKVQHDMTFWQSARKKLARSYSSIHLDALSMGIQESVHANQVIDTGTFYCTFSGVFTCANKGALSNTKTMVEKVVVPSSQNTDDQVFVHRNDKEVTAL